ncbi:MAG: hypothetical protein J1F66_00455 [Clostridiales bacterium]|nr:hypothetical protein [Clostridiales bacterium]
MCRAIPVERFRFIAKLHELWKKISYNFLTVTHVFVNDPTRGYGIYAKWMLTN